MKSRILFTLILILGISVSCEVEKIQPGELSSSINNTNENNSEPYTTPPCVLDSNKFSFGYTYEIKNIIANNTGGLGYIPDGCVNANYYILADMYTNSNGDVPKLEMYFSSEPKTGKYYTVSTDTLNSNSKDVYINIYQASGYSSKRYVTTDSNIVYVKNSNGSIKISFCESKFSSSKYDVKSNCKAQFTLVK